MIELDLRINSYPIRLGMLVDENLINNCKLKKRGFLYKSYRAKNCSISCFNKEFEIVPNLDKTTGRSLKYETSARIEVDDNHIESIWFKCGKDISVSAKVKEEFEKLCEKYYGELVIGTIGEGTTILRDEESWVHVYLSRSGKKACFDWSSYICGTFAELDRQLGFTKRLKDDKR